MDDFLDQIEVAANEGRLYYLALAGALVVPDLCGALESKDGEATGDKYKEWFNKHVAPMFPIRPDNGQPFLTGEDCWRFRCSFLHQGRTQHPDSGYTRILFVEPNMTGLHAYMNVLNDALNIDVGAFCADMLGAARGWLSGIRGTEPFETNLAAFVRRYPNGLPPYMVGMPIIS